MSQLSNNNQISDASEKPQLCRQCCEFFGNKDTDFLCSKCHKGKSNTSNAPKVSNTQFNLNNIISTAVSKMEEEKVHEEIKPVSMTIEQPKEQVDHKKCYICPKKTGSLGHQCKCGFTYCKSHRLPEDHECSFNFREEAAKKLAKENPLVVASKIAKI